MKKYINTFPTKKPDIIVLAGDMISRSDENPENWYNLSSLLDLLKGYPMYYSSGNHEKFLPRYNDYIAFFEGERRYAARIGAG